MTAWYQETELASDTVSSETSRHEYFNKTLDLAFKRLFPDSGTIETEVDREAASETPDTPFSNAFDILGRVPTEDESNLTEEEIQTLLADWSATNSKQQSEIIDDPFDDIFQFHRYVLDMDYLCTVIKTYWRMVATGSMAVPLAAWLTSAGFAQIQRICQVYHEEGITHEVLLREYLQKRARLQIQTGNDLTINEAARSGHDPLYKNFSSGPGLLTPVSALTEIFQNLSDKSWMSIKPSQKPTDFILSPRKESEERELLADMVCLSISDPTKLDLPKAEAEKALALTKKSGERDRKCMESMLRSMLQIGEQHDSFGHKGFENPMLSEVWDFCRGRYVRERLPRTDVVFGLMLLLETGKSFLWIDDAPNPVNLRLQVLRFNTKPPTF